MYLGRRSQSLPRLRQGDEYNPITGEKYQPAKESHNNSRNLSTNNSHRDLNDLKKQTANAILGSSQVVDIPYSKTQATSESPIKQPRVLGNGHNRAGSLSIVPMPTSNVKKWGDYIGEQAKLEDQYANQLKKNDKDRANRDILDRMAKQERERRIVERDTEKKSYVYDKNAIEVKKDLQECMNWNKIEKEIKLNQKHQMMTDIQKQIEQDKQMREQRAKQIQEEKLENELRIKNMKQLQQSQKEKELGQKKQMLDEYKQLLSQQREGNIERRIREQEENRNWSQKETQYFASYENNGNKLREKVKGKMMREFDAYTPFIQAQQQKEEKILSNIDKNMKERNQREQLNHQQKQDLYKKLHQDARSFNQILLDQKQKNLQQERVEYEAQRGLVQEKAAQLDMLETYEKQQRQKNKKEYLEFLNEQKQQQINPNETLNGFSKKEQIMNFRGNHEEDFIRSSLPLGKMSYERDLQLKYLDNWLNDSPDQPLAKKTIKNIRNDASKDVLEHKLFTESKKLTQFDAPIYGNTYSGR